MRLGSLAEDDLRVAQLLGTRPTGGFLIRSPSTLTRTLGRDGSPRWQLLTPEVGLTWNTEIPLSLNDGARWAGRGLTTQLSAGVRASLGPLALTLAPELLFSENRDFRIIPADLDDRSAFAYPWPIDDQSIDLPSRFGNESLVMLDPGQSTLSLDAGPVVLGASTENQWWGPGVRNALVLSNQAAGIPHLFLRTGRPIETPIGSLRGKWMAGALVESLYFDSESDNDLRAISALALEYQPVWDRDLTLGVARSVYSAVSSEAGILDRAGDALTHWETAPAADTLARSHEQILSLFGRWVFPRDGFEVYGEWARQRIPTNVRDFLTAPNHTQGYTVGLQWARPVAENVVRLQGEATYVEMSSTFKQRPVPTYYTARGIPQGYTHRGQVVGAGIGPGSSSQWIAGDFRTPGWQAGLYATRIRWQSDFLRATPSPASGRTIRSPQAYDVSMMAGLRGNVLLGRVRMGADLTLERRLNFLFQNPDAGFTSLGAVTVNNQSLRLFFEAPH